MKHLDSISKGEDVYSPEYLINGTGISVPKAKFVPSNKIVIGAAFYGRTAPFASKNDAKLGGKLTTTLSKTYSYTEIEEGIKNGTYIEMYDEVACANYIITTGANTAGRFITYDGVESVTAKCNYVYEKELGGIMFWDYTQDKNGTLIIAINNAFEKQKD